MKDESLNRKAVKSGFFFVLSQLFVRGVTFLTTPIYTRLLSTEQYGQIRVYESWLTIAVPIFSLCLWKSVERAKYDVNEEFDSYTSAVQNLSYIAILAACGVILLFKPQVEAFCDMDDTMLYTAFGYFFGYTSLLYMNRREKQTMRYKFATIMAMVMVVPATIISIVWLYIGNLRGETDMLVTYRIVGFYVPQCIVGLFIGFVLMIQGKKLFSKKYWAYGLAYSLPLIPEVISIQIMNQADKIMIRKMIGQWETGIYALGTTVSFIIWILEDSVWNAYLPWFYEKMTRGEGDEVEKPWTIVMHTFGLISWFLVLLTPEIVLVLGGRKNYDAVWVITPMILGTLFRFYSYTYTAVQNYYKKTQIVALGTILCMVLNVSLNYVFISMFGYRAAAYTTAFSYIFLLLLQGYLERRITGQWIVPLKTTMKISLIYLVLNMASMLTFELHFMVRYTILVIGGLAAAKFMLPQFMMVWKSLKKK